MYKKWNHWCSSYGCLPLKSFWNCTELPGSENDLLLYISALHQCQYQSHTSKCTQHAQQHAVCIYLTYDFIYFTRLYYFSIFIIVGHETLKCSQCTHPHTQTHTQTHPKWSCGLSGRLTTFRTLFPSRPADYWLLHRQDRWRYRGDIRHNDWDMLPVKIWTIELSASVANCVLLVHRCDYVWKYENTIKTENRNSSFCLHFV